MLAKQFTTSVNSGVIVVSKAQSMVAVGVGLGVGVGVGHNPNVDNVPPPVSITP